jgi:hypothetical protein
MPTVTKGARLTAAEQTLLAAVTAAPGLAVRSEADAFRGAALIGLRVLAVRGLLTGAAMPLLPEQLAKELALDLLPVFEFLLRHGALPALLHQAGLPSPSSTAPPLRPAAPTVAPEAGATLRAFGTSFLNDDDDDD